MVMFWLLHIEITTNTTNSFRPLNARRQYFDNMVENRDPLME